MRRHPLQWTWLVVAFALLWGAQNLRERLKQQQIAENLSFQGDNDTPPELSIAMSMGLFRSVILDVLWMRASALQQEKRFYEIVQLYDLIGKLQPHNARVWSYSSWNMAYNISVECPPGEERWRWVQNGLQRLIQHGLRYNPYDLELYKQTAWIYSHKIGRNLDDAHLYYKIKLCEQMISITGQERFSAKALVQQLHDSDPSKVEQAQKVKTELKKELGLELEFMAELEDDPFLGPLDWRLPQVQAIYWCRLGLSRNRFNERVIDLERIAYQAQQHLLRQGALIYTPQQGDLPPNLIAWPDYTQALPMQRMFERQIDLFENNNANSNGVRSAYRAFLDESLNILILAGQDTLAQELVQRALEKIPNILPSSNAKDLMRQQMSEQLRSMSGDEYSALIASLLMQHFWWKGRGDAQRSQALLRHAEQLWKTNAQQNKTGERSINRSFQGIYSSILSDIFQRQLFHPLILGGLKANLDPVNAEKIESLLKEKKPVSQK